MRQQIAPGLDCGLGFLDVFEKRVLRVKAAPASGFEQLGEVFQSLLSQLAPARDDIAAMSDVLSMCHIKPARKEKNGRGRNGTNYRDESFQRIGTHESLGRDDLILWKTFPLSSKQGYTAPFAVKNPEKYRLSCLSTVKHCAGMAGLRTSPTQD
jgi:hypothetical protein